MQRSRSAHGYKCLELRGSAYERGFGLGEYQRPIMRRLIESVCIAISSNTGLSKDGIVRFASKQAPYIEGYSDEIMSEVRGQADGASVPLQELMVIVASGSARFNYRSANPTTGCTAFAARGDATADGLTYIGNTMDGPCEQWLGGQNNAVWVYRRKDGPDALMYDWPGFVGSAGVNSCGLALGGNALPYARVRRGVPMSVVRREVLNQKTAADAIRAIARARPASAGNLLLADDKSIASVEAHPLGTNVVTSDDILCHANNFVVPTRYSGEGLPSHAQYLENSASRCARMGHLVEKQVGRLDLQGAQAILRDHNDSGEQGGARLCRHGDVGAERYTDRVKTYDAMVFVAEKKEAWIARGNPCQTPFLRYAV